MIVFFFEYFKVFKFIIGYMGVDLKEWNFNDEILRIFISGKFFIVM